MSFALAARAARAARRAARDRRLRAARAPPAPRGGRVRDAGAGPEPRRPQPRAAAPPPARARPARARGCSRPGSPGRTRPSRCSARRRRSCSRSTPRARWWRRTSRRAGSPPRSRPSARFLDKLPEGYRVGMVSFAQTAQVVAARRPPNRDAAQRALARLRPGDGTALGEGIARGDPGRAARPRPRRARRRRRRSSSSPTALRRRARSSRRRRPARRARRRSRSTPSRSAPPNGVVEVRDDDGFTRARSRSRPTRRRCARSRADRRALLRGARRRAARRGLRGARLAGRQRQEGARDHGRLRRGRGVPAPRRRRRSPPSSSGGCREALLLLVARRRRAPSPASAPPRGERRHGVRRACSVCIPVVGPWVQVPAGGDADLLPALLPRPRPDRSAGSTPIASGRVERRVPRRARRPGQPRRHDGRVGRLRRPDDARSLGELPAAARLHPGERRRRALAHVVRADAVADARPRRPSTPTLRRVKTSG